MAKQDVYENNWFLFCVLSGCTLKQAVNHRHIDEEILVDRIPSNPNASEATYAVLSTLASFTEGKQYGAISGQNLGHGIEAVENYKRYVETVARVSGEKPGMLGLDYEFERNYSLKELLSANQVLINHWQGGGWVTINYSPRNPWAKEDTLESIFKQFPNANLVDLVTQDTEENKKWLARLDLVAEALQNLEDNGVVVLWRPMQEMNGDWFWWGKKKEEAEVSSAGSSTQENSNYRHSNEDYIKVFRHMPDYFTRIKGLNNLLWVFSPNYDQSFSVYPYPGDDVVDIVSPTEYSDTLRMIGYKDALSFGKPVGFSEWGQAVWESKVKGGAFNNKLYAKKLRTKFSRAAYWVTWHSWYEAPVALIDNLHTKELMLDPYLINFGFREEGVTTSKLQGNP